MSRAAQQLSRAVNTKILPLSISVAVLTQPALPPFGEYCKTLNSLHTSVMAAKTRIQRYLNFKRYRTGRSLTVFGEGRGATEEGRS